MYLLLHLCTVYASSVNSIVVFTASSKVQTGHLYLNMCILLTLRDTNVIVSVDVYLCAPRYLYLVAAILNLSRFE